VLSGALLASESQSSGEDFLFSGYKYRKKLTPSPKPVNRGTRENQTNLDYEPSLAKNFSRFLLCALLRPPEFQIQIVNLDFTRLIFRAFPPGP
jgi:hypothetical protein